MKLFLLLVSISPLLAKPQFSGSLQSLPDLPEDFSYGYLPNDVEAVIKTVYDRLIGVYKSFMDQQFANIGEDLADQPEVLEQILQPLEERKDFIDSIVDSLKGGRNFAEEREELDQLIDEIRNITQSAGSEREVDQQPKTPAQAAASLINTLIKELGSLIITSLDEEARPWNPYQLTIRRLQKAVALTTKDLEAVLGFDNLERPKYPGYEYNDYDSKDTFESYDAPRGFDYDSN